MRKTVFGIMFAALAVVMLSSPSAFAQKTDDPLHCPKPTKSQESQAKQKTDDPLHCPKPPQSLKPKTNQPKAATRRLQPKVVDLRNGAPAKVELKVGQEILFENGGSRAQAVQTDKKGKLFQPRPFNAFNQNGRFRALREGTGEITVTLTSQGQLTVITTKVIQVSVVPNGPKTHAFDLYTSPIPSNLTLRVGDKVVYSKNTLKVHASQRSVSQQTTDNGKGNVLEALNFASVVDIKGNVKVRIYQAKRAGTAEIHLADGGPPGAPGFIHVIKVTVR